MKYFIFYRISDPDASRFGVEPHEAPLIRHGFESVGAAVEFVMAIKDDPKQLGFDTWVSFAYFWIKDSNGNIRWN